MAREGEVRWSVELFGHQLFTAGGPALAADGSIWVLSRIVDVSVPISRDSGIVYRLSRKGEILCYRELEGLAENYVIVPPGGSGAWVVGQTVYHLGHDCEVERSVETEAPFGVFLSRAVDPDGRLFAAAGFHLLAFDAALAEQWRSPRDRRASWLQPPTVTPERVYAKVTSDSLYTNAEAETWFAGSPAIAPDGTVYTTSERRVYAIFGSHPPDVTSPWPMWRRNAQRTGWVP